MIKAVEGVYKCLLDPDLPVKVKAAVTLNCLLLYKDAQTIIKPGLNQILEIYLRLMDESDCEDIVASLEVFLFIKFIKIIY